MTQSERKELKQRKCKNKLCGKLFTPTKPLQSVCDFGCAIELNLQNKAKRARKEHREAKERIKSRGDWTREAQAEFNRFIRLRDSKFPCISCGRHHTGQYHAGHYRTVGANPELRFEELNVHKQCAPCNDHLHGNLINYRISLIKRIGIEKVEWLEGQHDPKKYSIDDLKQIKANYRKKANEILKGTGNESA